MLKAVNSIRHLHNSNILRISGNRKVETVALKEVQPLTGYIRGGVTALASKKDYLLYLDETATLFEQITVSGGVRGMLLLLSPSDYLRAVNGTLGTILQN